MKEIDEVVGIAKRVEHVRTQLSRISWVHYTTGFDFGLEKKYSELTSLYEDKLTFEKIVSYRDKALSRLDKRRVELLYKIFKPFHVSKELNDLDLKIKNLVNSLSHLLNTFRFQINGKTVRSTEVLQILSSSDDRELRKKAFLSATQINKPLIDAGFIELIRMRKQYADLFGNFDFVTYKLDRDEMPANLCQNWKDDVHALLPAMKKASTELGLKHLDDPDLKPWDVNFISSRIAPEMNAKIEMIDFFEPVNKLFIKFGFDLGAYNITYDIFPRHNKSEWGYNFPIQTGVDSRILANVENRFSDFGMLLHETGHAVHTFNTNPEELLLNLGISSVISEGVANLFQSFQKHPIFYRPFFHAQDYPAVDENMANLKKWSRLRRLRSIPSIIFDQSLYRHQLDTLADINNLYWNIYAEYLNEEPYAEEPVWANTIHHTTHPIYLHNYLLGDVTKEMLKQIFCKNHQIDEILEKPTEFGQFIKENIFEVSGKYPFLEWFKQISGEECSLKYLIF